MSYTSCTLIGEFDSWLWVMALRQSYPFPNPQSLLQKFPF